MVEQLTRLPSRTLRLVLVSVVGLTLTAAFLYVLKKPIAEYRRLRHTRAVLLAEVADGDNASAEVARLEREVEAAEEQLLRGGSAVPLNQMVAYVIGRLDRISKQNAVELVGVKPNTSKSVFMFEEIPFEVEVKGGYFRLFDWLHDVERELGPMVVKQFEITPERSSKKTRMTMTMVSYRPAEREERRI